MLALILIAAGVAMFIGHRGGSARLAKALLAVGVGIAVLGFILNLLAPILPFLIGGVLVVGVAVTASALVARRIVRRGVAPASSAIPMPAAAQPAEAPAAA